MKILLISHGDFAKGLASTATTFFGATSIYTACVTQERGVEDLKDKVNAYLAEWGDEQVVICSDLKGGSANQTAVQNWLSRPNTFIVSGTNLAVVLQLVVEPEVTEEKLREILELAKQDVCLVNDLFKNAPAQDEEDE